MWDKRAKNVSVHDGDTLTMVLDQGFRETTEITVRLFGVWAPELKQPGGPETLAFVREWLAQESAGGLTVWPFLVTTIRGPRSDKEVKTLDRYVAVVESIDHARNLNMDVGAFVAFRGYTGGTGAPPGPVS